MNRGRGGKLKIGPADIALIVLMDGPGTVDDVIEEMTGLARSVEIQPAFNRQYLMTQMAQMAFSPKLLRQTGEKPPETSGKRQPIWELTDAGREEAARTISFCQALAGG